MFLKMRPFSRNYRCVLCKHAALDEVTIWQRRHAGWGVPRPGGFLSFALFIQTMV